MHSPNVLNLFKVVLIVAAIFNFAIFLLWPRIGTRVVEWHKQGLPGLSSVKIPLPTIYIRYLEKTVRPTSLIWGLLLLAVVTFLSTVSGAKFFANKMSQVEPFIRAYVELLSHKHHS